MIKRDTFLPFCRPTLGEEEEKAVVDVLRSGWITTGPKVQEFEQKFAEYKGVKYAVATSSGTAALMLAMAAAGVKRGYQVVTPAITWPSTINSIINLGARPVLVDVDRDTLNITEDAVIHVTADMVRAVIPVHMAGLMCDMKGVTDAVSSCRQFVRTVVIEDAAHALDSEDADGNRAGTVGEAGMFSFHPIKNITAAESGMLATTNKEIADKVRLLGNNGIDKTAWGRYGSKGFRHWEVQEVGHKCNMPDVLAAIGICQLEKAQQFWQKRKSIADIYLKELAGLDEIKLPVIGQGKHGYHLFIIQVDGLRIDRDEFLDIIQSEYNVGVGVHFRAAHLQPAYKFLGYKVGSLPNSEYVSEHIVSLPMYPLMTEDDAYYVAESVKDIVKRYRR